MMVYKIFENYTSLCVKSAFKIVNAAQLQPVKIRGGAFHECDLFHVTDNNTPVLSKNHTYAQLEPIGKTSSALLDQAEV